MFVRYTVEHIFDGESSGFSFYIGMEHGLKHDIAELPHMSRGSSLSIASMTLSYVSSIKSLRIEVCV